MSSMSISSLFRRRTPDREAAATLLDRAIAQSRRPAFYEVAGVPDTLDGRFDLMVLHVFLVVQRLHRIAGAGDTTQAVIDRMFAVLDLNLRELGVQDMGIGKRIKVMVQGFNGRVAAYRTALATDRAALQAALRRNAFGGASPRDAHVVAMAAYVGATIAALDAIPDLQVVQGGVGFPDPMFDSEESAL